MLGLSEIIKVNKKTGRQAKNAGRKPLLAKVNGKIAMIPDLGDYTPKGYKLINSYFVYSSDFGVEGDPALTIEQFLAKVVKGKYYGIGRQGQFQIDVNEFEKI